MTRPQFAPCTKTQYSKREAETIRNVRLKSRHGHPQHLRVYHCRMCNTWHLTHLELHEQTEIDE